MPRHQVRRGLTAVAMTAMALTLTPPAHAAEEPTTPAPATEPAPEPELDSAPISTPDGPQDAGDGESDQPEQEQSRKPKTRRPVRLKVARKKARVVSTTRRWPAALLKARGVQVDGNDLVRVYRDGYTVARPHQRRLRAGDTVQLVVVTSHTRTVRQRVTPPTVTRTVSRLAPGKRKVVAQGRPGVRRVTTRRTMHNWRTTSVHRTRSTVRKARPRRVLVGRAFGSVPGADHRNWRALARCESGNNPRAVNPSGKYHGLYQFDRRTWGSVGGSGLPSRASASEQTYRAKLLFKRRGRSPWPHCGRYL